MRTGVLLLVGLLAVVIGGCAGDPGEAGGELTEMVARAGDFTDGSGAETPGATAAEDGAAASEDLGEATRDEVAALCTLYRKALRGRWDDGRTRGEVRGLELTTPRARGWQTDLAEGDVNVAREASRAVVEAGLGFQLTSECEPLRALVATADDIKAAPGSLQR